MAIAEVSGQRATATPSGENDSAAIAFPNNVTSGNLLIVGGAVWNDPANTSISVTDSLGTTYTTLLGTIHTGNRLRSFIAYGIAPSSGANTVTVNPNGSNTYMSFSIDEFSGVDSTPLDADGGTTTGTGTAIADSITTASANALIIGVCTHNVAGSPTLTPGGSYTQIGELELNDDTAHNAVFRIATTATSYSVDWTLGSSGSWSAQTASFKEAAAGGGLPFFMQGEHLTGGMQDLGGMR